MYVLRRLLGSFEFLIDIRSPHQVIDYKILNTYRLLLTILNAE